MATKALLNSKHNQITTKKKPKKAIIESLQHIQLHLKAYYNQDSIPNKDKQSDTQRQIYQEQKRQTKWGYILFNKEVDIDSKLKELTKDFTIPITKLKEFNRIYKEDSITFINQINEPSNIDITNTETKTNITQANTSHSQNQTNIAHSQSHQTSIDSKSTNNINKDFNNTESKDYLLGEEIDIVFKEQWEDKQIRFFAYIESAKSDVGVDVEIKKSIPSNVIRIETEDNSGEYIEIILPNDNDTDNSDDELNNVLHEAKDILYELSPLSSIQSAYDNLKAGEYKEALLEAITAIPQAKVLKTKKLFDKTQKIIDKINKAISKDKCKKDARIAKPKPKSLSREEVLGIINGLEKGSTKNTRLVNTKKELDELWQKLTKNATKIEEKQIPITNKNRTNHARNIN